MSRESRGLAPQRMTIQFLEGVSSRFMLAALVMLCATLGACDAPTRPGPGGYVYFGSGGYLGRLSLGDGSSEIVAHIGEGSVTSVGNYKDGELLLTVRRLVNSTEVQMITRFDLATKHYTNLFAGNTVAFLPDEGTTVYDDGINLLATRIVDNDRRLTKIYAHDFNATVTIVAISDQALLFQVSKGNDSKVFHYDVATEIHESLDEFSTVCDLQGAVWVPEIQQMLCQEPGGSRSKSQYRFVSMDGQLGNVVPRPGKNPFRPLLYLPGQRVLVLTEAWRGFLGGRQRYAVWIYDLASGESYRLVKDQYLGNYVAYKPLQ